MSIISLSDIFFQADWFFPENENEPNLPMVPLAVPDSCDEFETNNQALLNNISKYEGCTARDKVLGDAN